MGSKKITPPSPSGSSDGTVESKLSLKLFNTNSEISDSFWKAVEKFWTCCLETIFFFVFCHFAHSSHSQIFVINKCVFFVLETIYSEVSPHLLTFVDKIDANDVVEIETGECSCGAKKGSKIVGGEEASVSF